MKNFKPISLSVILISFIIIFFESPNYSRNERVKLNTTQVTECSTCKGSGVCKKCSGTGVYYQSPNRPKAYCEDCQKTGTCYACLGKGKLNVPGCSICNGTGSCKYCLGSGKKLGNYYNTLVDCGTCNASGKCQRCLGTGRKN